jgi:hypothetical protein
MVISFYTYLPHLVVTDDEKQIQKEKQKVVLNMIRHHLK